MGVVVIQDTADFNKKVKEENKGKLIVVDFFATWCGPCRMIAPKLEAMSNEMQDVLFFKVDVDQCEDVAASNGISAMPTFFFFKDGEKVGDVVGASEEKIKEEIEKHQK